MPLISLMKYRGWMSQSIRYWDKFPDNIRCVAVSPDQRQFTLTPGNVHLFYPTGNGDTFVLTD